MKLAELPTPGRANWLETSASLLKFLLVCAYVPLICNPKPQNKSCCNVNSTPCTSAESALVNVVSANTAGWPEVVESGPPVPGLMAGAGSVMPGMVMFVTLEVGKFVTCLTNASRD